MQACELAREIQAEEEKTAKLLFPRISPMARVAFAKGVSEGRS